MSVFFNDYPSVNCYGLMRCVGVEERGCFLVYLVKFIWGLEGDSQFITKVPDEAYGVFILWPQKVR